jgi:predicted ATPase/DNA-binding XRE family transcriptional regulator
MGASASFGSWLRQQRKFHDWTQAELAEQVGCSIALIRKYEADERRPSKQIAGILADVFAIPSREREFFFAYVRGSAPRSVIPPSNLPSDRTPFIGRQSELELLRMRIASPECRLLVLTGPGGIGKTRLAIQASRAMLHHFPDGVFFINLVGVDSAEYLVSSIAAALALSFHGLADFKVQLLHHLGARRLLLLLDNYEHLLPHTELITEILEAAPDVKIVVTSRERLNVREEWGFPVKGLAYPQDTVGDYADFETVRLFEQRAAQANSHRLLTDTDRPFIGRICELAQGNPLAIELAAAWTRMLSCQEVAEAIQSNWDFPLPEPRNAPERHRSMNAVFEHTWKRLSQEEQTGFMKLSVFRGGFTPEAARGVANVTLLVLANLQDKSLLTRSANGRYEIHELLRRYGEARLHELPDTLADAHESFIADTGKLLEDLRNAMWTARHKQAVTQIKVEIDNIRHAWNLATLSSSWAFFGQAAESMWHYYNDTNLFEEGYAIFEQAAAHLASQARTPAQALALAQLFHGPGWFAQRLGRPLEAKTLLDTSLTWLGTSGLTDVRNEMLIKGSAFFVAQALNDDEEAKHYADECLKIGQQSGDEIALAAGRMFSGIIALAAGDMRTAKNLFHEAVRYLEPSGSQRTLAYLLNELGQVELAERNFRAAKSLFQRSVDLFYDHDDVGNAAGTLILLGHTQLEMGHSAQAAVCFYEALQQSSAVHALPVTSDALIEIASLLVDAAEWTAAVDILKAVRSHPAIKQESRVRIDALLANMSEASSPTTGDDEVTTDDLEHAITVALRAEALLQGKK